MFLRSLASAFPDTTYTQQQCWDILCESPAPSMIRGRSVSIMEKVLKGESGIETRRFCIDDPMEMFSLDAEQLNHRFEQIEFHLKQEPGQFSTHDRNIPPQNCGPIVCSAA